MVHKRIELDVAVTLDDNTQVNVEMQMASHEFFMERMHYCWDRRHAQQLSCVESAEYCELRPNASIIVTDFELFKSTQEKELFHLTVGLTLPKAGRLLMGGVSEDPVELWGEYMLQPTLPLLESRHNR